jgi:peptidoglycan/LPS O-acetylase OafA/YrhL
VRDHHYCYQVGIPAPETIQQTVTSIRTDIQALRGLAVLMVVFYHVKIGSVDAGYLGVDVFFVISGYLITSLVSGGIERGDFRLADFYFRRAKRLLPAAYITVLVTALLAPWFLDQLQLHDFALQVIGAISFTANIVLWRQTGYFEGVSDLKPLLHMWSLSLEEQYYMLLPAALLLLRRSLWSRVVVAVLVLSLGLCLLGSAFKPNATFYLLPTRAWELLIGSMGALLVGRDATAGDRIARSPVIRSLFFPSLFCLLLLPLWPIGGRHPGAGAVAICLSTLVVILRRYEGLDGSRAIRALARVGDFSYSLYLVHWPIIALLKNAWVGPEAEFPVQLRLAALALAFAAAYPLYRFVENPIHRARFRYSPWLLAKTGLASVFLMLIAPTALQVTKASTDFREVRRINFGFGEACEYSTIFAPKQECSSGGDAPKVLVWGDSYAMHLVPGLLQLPAIGGVIQATRSNCGPILDLGPQRLINPEPGVVYDRAWAEKCIEFNQSVLEFLRHSRSIETVVLSSPLTQYVDSVEWASVMRRGTVFNVERPSIDNTADALVRTVRELQMMGKKVLLVAPPPSADFDIGTCLERQLTGLIAMGGSAGCVVPMDVYRAKRRAELALLDAIEKAGVPVVRLDSFLCDARSCQTLIDGTMIYRDKGHLSYEGSGFLATRMNWAGLIEQQDR